MTTTAIIRFFDEYLMNDFEMQKFSFPAGKTIEDSGKIREYPEMPERETETKTYLNDIFRWFSCYSNRNGLHSER